MTSPTDERSEPTDRQEILERTEQRLDPGDPERGGVRVLGYGEISVALTLAELPGLVCKRMAGFADERSAATYVDLVEGYLARLARAGVRVAPTDVVTVRRDDRAPVVYLLQPQLPADSLGPHLLLIADDDTLRSAIGAALAVVGKVARHSAAGDEGAEVAVDGQLSNWSFADDPAAADPVLFDVGTPFVRRGGAHAIDVEVLLAPVPPGIRAYYRRKRLVEAYLDDYFVPRTVAVDLLGNFYKEGAADRLPVGIAAVDDWLATDDLPGPRHRVTADEVERYYRKDADLLALYLRLRRMDRFLRTRLLRRTYDYVLPGQVQR
jgi:Family of unknown function (DUF6206)